MDDYLNFPVVQQILPPIVTNVQNMNYQLRSKVPAFQLNRQSQTKHSRLPNIIFYMNFFNLSIPCFLLFDLTPLPLAFQINIGIL